MALGGSIGWDDLGGVDSGLMCPPREWEELSAYRVADARILHLNEELVLPHLIKYDGCQLERGIGRVDDEGLGLDVGSGSHDWWDFL